MNNVLDEEKLRKMNGEKEDGSEPAVAVNNLKKKFSARKLQIQLRSE